ncbi:MAG: flgL [Clostridia bacterium]|nr:flgL [Clostridia bacterium]
MRITNSMMLNSMMRNMGKNLNRMSKTEEMLATGKKFSLPSDDPIGVSRSLRLNTDVANMEQYKRNVEDAQSWLGTTEMAINNLINIFQRARELTVQAANETNSVDERKAIAAEIDQLKGQIISTANTTYAGSYIFSGFKTNQALMSDDGEYLPVDLSKNEVIEFNVGISDRMGINVLPQKLFGIMGTASADDPVDANTLINSSTPPVPPTYTTPQMIQVFADLVDDLEGDDTAAISNALKRLDIHLNNINAVRAEVGVKSNRLELTLNRIEDDTLNLKDLLSKNEDADMAEVIMNLKMQENVYKSSLSGGARIIQPTLIDFLR